MQAREKARDILRGLEYGGLAHIVGWLTVHIWGGSYIFLFYFFFFFFIHMNPLHIPPKYE